MSLWIFYRYVFGNNPSYDFDTEQIVLLILCGLLGAAGNQIVIIAMQQDKAGRIASMMFIAVLIGYIEDIAIFNYDIGVFEAIGAILVVCCSLTTLLFKFYKFSD